MQCENCHFDEEAKPNALFYLGLYSVNSKPLSTFYNNFTLLISPARTDIGFVGIVKAHAVGWGKTRNFLINQFTLLLSHSISLFVDFSNRVINEILFNSRERSLCRSKYKNERKRINGRTSNRYVQILRPYKVIGFAWWCRFRFRFSCSTEKRNRFTENPRLNWYLSRRDSNPF